MKSMTPTRRPFDPAERMQELKDRRERQRSAEAGFTPSPRAGLKSMSKAGLKAVAEQQFQMDAEGTGYVTMQPTKGPRRISGKRLEAQNRMNAMKRGKSPDQSTAFGDAIDMIKRAYSAQPEALAA